MNREEFMAKLKALLGDIPAEEREEDVSYTHLDVYKRQVHGGAGLFL